MGVRQPVKRHLRHLNMASITSEDANLEDNSSISSSNSCFTISSSASDCSDSMSNTSASVPVKNLVFNLVNRERYGRFARGPKAKTDKVFRKAHEKCQIVLKSLIGNPGMMSHIFMGFTLCGQYFLSFTEMVCSPVVNIHSLIDMKYEYFLYIWRFVPGENLKIVSQHRIFNHNNKDLENVKFMQFPNDMHKLVCYGREDVSDIFYITILTLPSATAGCVHCIGAPPGAEFMQGGWCKKHGFIIDFQFSMSQPSPDFNPDISLAFPNYLVVNTGHYIHILNISTVVPVPYDFWRAKEDDAHSIYSTTANNNFNDAFSEISELASDHSGFGNVIESILEDFSEYDLDSTENGGPNGSNKPFHELNISCEPLNVTGKSYHNTLVQNIFDPRIKRMQSGGGVVQKPPEKTRAIAEKAYEFTEENEKYEKISLFRKKRLADKKYEFSEDNAENIVPLHILRRERRCHYRNGRSATRSSEIGSLFLSPRSPSWRSPSSRAGQFSPGGARHLYCRHSKSPISPRDAARRVNVYSPSLESGDWTPLNLAGSTGTAAGLNHGGLLIVDPKRDTCKWLMKMVRRFSNGDLENGSLVSGQSRDESNIPLEIPLLIDGLAKPQSDDQTMDNAIMERQIIVNQRTMDCEQFVEHRAEIMCTELGLRLMYLADYDIKLINVCPLSGEMLCNAFIKVGATESSASVLQMYSTNIHFVWNIVSDAFDIVEKDAKLSVASPKLVPPSVPPVHCHNVWVLGYDSMSRTKTCLRDPEERFEIYLVPENGSSSSDFSDAEEYRH